MSIYAESLKYLLANTGDLSLSIKNPQATDTPEKVSNLGSRVSTLINEAGRVYRQSERKQEDEDIFLAIFNNLIKAKSQLDLAERTHFDLAMRALEPRRQITALQMAKSASKSMLKTLDEKVKIRREFGIPLVRAKEIVEEITRIGFYLRSKATPFERDSVSSIFDEFGEMTFEIEDLPADAHLISHFNADLTPLDMTTIRTFIHEMGRKFHPSAHTREDPSLMLFPRDTRVAEMQNPFEQKAKVSLPNLSEMVFTIGGDESVVCHRIFFHMYFIQNHDPESSMLIDRNDTDWGKTAFLDKTKSTPQQRFRAVQRTRAEWLLSTIKQGIISDADRPHLRKEKPEVYEKNIENTPFTIRESYPVMDNPFRNFFPPIDRKEHPGEVEFEPSETSYLSAVLVPNFTDADGKNHLHMLGFEEPKRPLKLNKLFPLLYVKLHQVCSRNASSDPTVQKAFDTHHQVKRTGPILDIYAGFGRAALLHEVNVDSKYKLEAIEELEKELRAHWKV